MKITTAFLFGLVTAFMMPQGMAKDENIYLELSGNDRPVAFGAEAGAATENEHFQFRVGYALKMHEDLDEFFYTGPVVGVRAFANKGISPFVGVSAFAGYYERTVEARDDFIDNDKDGAVDERGEVKTEVGDIVAAIIPEAGIRLGSHKGSVTLFSKYHITTDGDANDFWTAGIGFRF